MDMGHVRKELAQLRDHLKIGNSILLGVCETTFYPREGKEALRRNEQGEIE
jgi:hypothetical protein